MTITMQAMDGTPFRGDSPFKTALQVVSEPPRPPGLIVDLGDLRAFVESHRVPSLCRNAKTQTEERLEIRYWSPVDDREPFGVVYRFKVVTPRVSKI